MVQDVATNNELEKVAKRWNVPTSNFIRYVNVFWSYLILPFTSNFLFCTRAGPHDVTWKNGELVKDDRGSHWTISAETREMEELQQYFVAYLYHHENDFYELREAVFEACKADNTKKWNGNLFWATDSGLIDIKPEECD